LLLNWRKLWNCFATCSSWSFGWWGFFTCVRLYLYRLLIHAHDAYISVVRYMHLMFPTEHFCFFDKMKWILIY
jgi:hypothetical protein